MSLKSTHLESARESAHRAAGFFKSHDILAGHALPGRSNRRVVGLLWGSSNTLGSRRLVRLKAVTPNYLDQTIKFGPSTEATQTAYL
jgi:hypothetical protein